MSFFLTHFLTHSVPAFDLAWYQLYSFSALPSTVVPRTSGRFLSPRYACNDSDASVTSTSSCSIAMSVWMCGSGWVTGCTVRCFLVVLSWLKWYVSAGYLPFLLSFYLNEMQWNASPLIPGASETFWLCCYVIDSVAERDTKHQKGVRVCTVILFSSLEDDSKKTRIKLLHFLKWV